MQDVVRFGKCLGDPSLVRVMNLLRGGEICVCELEEALQFKQGAVIARLKKLQALGIVRIRERWYAASISDRYSDLVETVFELFEDSLAWDQTLAQDSANLQVSVQGRDDGWCPNSRYSKGSVVVPRATRQRKVA